jgi:hypothetical protein
MSDTDTEINVQRDWDFDVNLSGLIAPTGKGGNVLPTGFYKVKLMDLYVNPERNPNRVIIKVQVAEGPFTGTIRTSGFNKPTSDDDKVRYYWRGLAESAGYSPADLDAGAIRLGLGTFKGRLAYIMFTEKDEDAGVKYEDMDFLPPMEWAQQAENFTMTGGASAPVAEKSAPAGSALGVTAPTKATSLGGGSTASLGDNSGGTASLGGGGNSLPGTKKSALLTQLGVN